MRKFCRYMQSRFEKQKRRTTKFRRTYLSVYKRARQGSQSDLGEIDLVGHRSQIAEQLTQYCEV